MFHRGITTCTICWIVNNAQRLFPLLMTRLTPVESVGSATDQTARWIAAGMTRCLISSPRLCDYLRNQNSPMRSLTSEAGLNARLFLVTCRLKFALTLGQTILSLPLSLRDHSISSDTFRLSLFSSAVDDEFKKNFPFFRLTAKGC